MLSMVSRQTATFPINRDISSGGDGYLRVCSVILKL